MHALLGEFRQCICLFCGFGLLARWRYYPIENSILIARPDCALQFLAGKRKYIFEQESFYLHGILDDINEQDTFCVDCKHKHMMKSRAPPDKFGVLYRMVTYRIQWDGMGPFNSGSFLYNHIKINNYNYEKIV